MIAPLCIVITILKKPDAMQLKLTLVCALICIHMSVFAAPTDKLNLSVGVAYENSNNIYLSPVKVSDNILHLLASADYQKETSTLNIHFNLNADHENYEKNSYPDQTIYSSLLGFAATLVKNRFFWDIDNRFDNVPSSNAVANTPNNAENTNYFSTGPRFVFFKNTKDALTADVKYQNFYAQKSDSDYSGYIMSASYIRNATRTFTTGLTVNYNNKKFDNQTVNTNYSKRDIVISFKDRMRLSEAELDIGNTYLNIENSPDYEHAIFRAKYNYELGVKTKFNLSYKKELADYSGLFSTITTETGELSNVGSSVFLLEEGRISAVKNFGASTVTLGYTYFSNDYYGTTSSDSNTSSPYFSYINNLSNTLTLNVSGSYAGIEYPGIPRNDTERTYIIGLKKIFSNIYDINFNIKYTDRGSTNPNFIYDERRISLAGHYYFR